MTEFPRRYEGRVIRVRTLPPRTTVFITGVDEDGYAIVESYKCVDCKLSTPDVDVMLAHQRDPGLWHRVRRWFLRAPKGIQLSAERVTLGGNHAHSHNYTALS